MTGHQIAVILDFYLPLNDREGQISHNGSPCAQKPVNSGINIIHLCKAEAFVEKQGITHHRQNIDKGAADEYAEIYRLSGIETFVTSSMAGDGVEVLSLYIKKEVRCGRTAAFAGASGVGKSTLMNALFPELTLATAEISRKIERGRHTTRHVEIFDIEAGADTGFLADTPGFSLIDFARFDFFSLDELLPTFPELLPYLGKCRYADCAHVGEGIDECAVAKAASEGKIAESRLNSYRSIWRTLKEKTTY